MFGCGNREKCEFDFWFYEWLLNICGSLGYSIMGMMGVIGVVIV